METIKNYLETMFANMPNTSEVVKAKAELLQMMEDKYNELINEGVSENTAVGTVISEFGNLDELADELGLTKEIKQPKANDDFSGRYLGMDEVKEFLSARGRKAVLLSLGIMLLVSCVAWPILISSDAGAALMFLTIAVGVGLIVFSSLSMSNYRYIEEEPVMLDMSTASYVNEQRRAFQNIKALSITLGIILCIICWLPNIIFYKYMDNLGPAMMFFLAGLGVLLIVYGCSVNSGYDVLLKRNESYAGIKVEGPVRYKSKAAETVVAVYWPTVVCLYLSISFLTFAWSITWIIWPIAAVAHNAVVINCQEDEE